MISIVLTSRNNYNFLDQYWAPRIKAEGFPILNIDEESSPDEKQKGVDICRKWGIEYVDCNARGMQFNIQQACERFDDASLVVWFQHDCWPIREGFFSGLDNLNLKKFGAVGFNGVATDVCQNYNKHYKKVLEGKDPLGIVARCPLSCRMSWYSGYSQSSKIPAIKNKQLYREPFAVESLAWFAAAVCPSQYLAHIMPTGDYQFFHAWDDICFQFLNKNVYNIVLPKFHVAHRPDLKPRLGLPVRSIRTAKKTDRYHGIVNHLEVWQQRWGWDWEKPATYAKVRDRYKDTLIDGFFRHDPEKGPVRTFEVVS